MKKLFFIAVIASAALAASSVMASPTNSATGNTMDTQEVRDSALRSSYAAGEAFKTARGTYAMDDGSTLSLYKSGSKFVA